MVRRSLTPELLEFIRDQRRNATDAESLLWECLRGHQLGGYKFRRQHPAAGYVLDFYCPMVKLAIEVDGCVHNQKDQHEYDSQRTENLAHLGIKVIRFWNSEVLNDTDRVLLQIQRELDARNSR